MNNALYFPNINLPSTSWTCRTLLYWDSVSTIVPHSLHEKKRHYTSQMRDLLEAGLVRPISPAQLFHASQAIAHPFSRYLSQLRPDELTIRRGEEAVAHLHIEKITDTTRRALVEYCGALEVEDGWWQVPTPIANRYMAMLALTMAQENGLQANPVTDKQYQLQLFNQAHGHLSADSVFSEVRNDLLKELFPIPLQAAKVDALIKFKEKYGDQLRTFRATVEKEVFAVASIENDEKRKAAMAVSREYLEVQRQSAIDAMRINFRHILFNTIVPASISALTFKLGGDIPGMASAGYGLVQAASSAVRDLTGANAMEMPMAYAAFASRFSFR